MKKILCLVLTIGLSLSLLAACSTGDEKPYLNVYNWGIYIDPEVLDIFEAETGIKIKYSEFDTNEDMYSKIKTNTTGDSYDVIFPSDYMIEQMIDEDMLAELDTTKMENYQHIDPKFLDTTYDPGNKFSVPYMWGTLGILYNTDMVDQPVDSWDILWNPDYTKEIYMMKSVRDSIAVALKKLGYSLNSTDPTELDAAKAALTEQKPLVIAYTGDEIKSKMLGQNGALCVVFSGDAITIVEEGAEQGLNFEYVLPKEGSNIWVDGMCILKTSKKYDMALQFIDFMCREDIAELNRAEINYATPQLQVYDALPDDIKNNALYYPADEHLVNFEYYQSLPEHSAVYNELWAEVLAK